jgi:hypothetical protein
MKFTIDKDKFSWLKNSDGKEIIEEKAFENYFGEMGILKEDEVKEFANRLFAWYMGKFPDKYLMFNNEGEVLPVEELDSSLEYPVMVGDEVIFNSKKEHLLVANNSRTTSKIMNFDNLKRKLLGGDYTNRLFRECTYESNYDINNTIYKTEIENDLMDNPSHIYVDLFLNSKMILVNTPAKECIIVADSKSGNVVNVIGDNLSSEGITILKKVQYTFNGEKLDNWYFMVHKQNGLEENKIINLEDLYANLGCYEIGNLDLSYLEGCISKRNNDIEMIKKVIDFVALSLVFGKKYNPMYDYISDTNSSVEFGYFRASMFLNDFNSYYNWDLPSDYLDELISKNIKDKEEIKTRKKVRKKASNHK